MHRAFGVTLTVAASRVDTHLTGQTLAVDVAVLWWRNAAPQFAGVVRWAVVDDAAFGRIAQALHTDEPGVALPVAGAGCARFTRAAQTPLVKPAIVIASADEWHTAAVAALVAPFAVIIVGALRGNGHTVPVLAPLVDLALVIANAHGPRGHALHLQADFAAATIEVRHAGARSTVGAPPSEADLTFVTIGVGAADVIDGDAGHLEADLAPATLFVGGASARTYGDAEPVLASLASRALTRDIAGPRPAYAVITQVTDRTGWIARPLRRVDRAVDRHKGGVRR